MTAPSFPARLAEARRQVAHLPVPRNTAEADQVDAAARQAAAMWDATAARSGGSPSDCEPSDWNDLAARILIAVSDRLRAACPHLAARPTQPAVIDLDLGLACCPDCRAVLPPDWHPHGCSWCGAAVPDRTASVIAGGVIATGAACADCDQALAAAAQERT